jgi:uncharacterized protein (DUF302 family)
MIRGMRSLAAIAATTILGVGNADAAEATISKDLTATLALLGVPCDQVVSSQRLGDNDYLATCKDKNSYRIYVNAKGRVVADKR